MAALGSDINRRAQAAGRRGETMKVASLPRPGACEIITKPMPVIKRDYVLVRIVVAPMCNEYIAYQSWDFRDRNRPDSLGHEAAGEVVEAPSSSGFRAGDRVVALCGYPCHRCLMCRSGRYAHCASTENPLEVCGSPSGECGFAQYMIKPEWLLLPVPAGMPYEHASMACCGLGATFTALERMGAGTGDTVLVTGLGAVGLGAVINSVARGARVIGAGRVPYRAALARDLGALGVINPDADDPARQVAELADGPVDFAVECSAQPSYQRLALDALRRGGEAAFLGESGDLTMHVDRDLIQKGVTLRGSLDLYLGDAPRMLETIALNGPLIDRFITHEYPLGDIEKAWNVQMARTCGKIIIRPWA